MPMLASRGVKTIGKEDAVMTFSSSLGVGHFIKSKSNFLGPMSKIGEVEIAFLNFWSWKTSPSGDPHWTIPEVFAPAVRSASPNACVVVATDDLQFIRFSSHTN